MTMEVPCCEIETCQHASLDNRIVRFESRQVGVVIFVLCERHESAFQRFVARDALAAVTPVMVIRDELGHAHFLRHGDLA